MRCVVAAIALGFSLPAHAISRLVFQLPSPMTVRVDGHDVPNSGGRAVASGIQPGLHEVFVATANGSTQSTQLQVDDGQSVTILVGADGSLQLRGPGARIASTGAGTTKRSSSVASDAAATDPKPDEPDQGSFDLNAGTEGGATPAPERGDRNYEAVSRGVSTVGRAAGSVIAPGATAIVGTAAPVVARGATNRVRNAQAGGVNDLRSGPKPGRQGTARPPKTITGTVNIEAAPADGFVIYVGGMEVSRVAAGGQVSVKVPVGRQPVEFWDADTGTVRWRGVLEVDQAKPITVRVSDAAPPSAVERSWAWSNR